MNVFQRRYERFPKKAWTFSGGVMYVFQRRHATLLEKACAYSRGGMDVFQRHERLPEEACAFSRAAKGHRKKFSVISADEKICLPYAEASNVLRAM